MRASGEGYVQCQSNADCDEGNIGFPAGDCELVKRRPCFLDPIVAEGHPWVGRSDISPKSIARVMVVGFQGCDSYVRQDELQRVEGLLLRYLGNVYSVLTRNVADAR